MLAPKRKPALPRIPSRGFPVKPKPAKVKKPLKPKRAK
jgi:hypothetical protein